jgi:hypothetical protein
MRGSLRLKIYDAAGKWYSYGQLCEAAGKIVKECRRYLEEIWGDVV